MEMKWVYDDGSIMTPEVFNLSPDEILSKFRKGVNNLAAISLNLGMPNQLSIPHMVINGFKNIASIGLETGLKFKQLEALTSGAKAAPAQAPKKEEPKAAPKKEVKEEKVEEVDVGGGMGDMFGD